MYYLGLTHLIAGSAPSCNPTIAYLLPVCVCQFHVRSWRCDMYYCGRPIYTIPEYISRKYKSSANITIPEYISRKYKSSANILYNDYAEDLFSGYIYTTYARIHTIEM